MSGVLLDLTKADFIQFLNCTKSLQLKKKKPDVYPEGEFSAYAQQLAAEGYEVEVWVRTLVASRDDKAAFSFQETFETEEGFTRERKID